MAAAASSNNPLVQIATGYVNYIDTLFSKFKYKIVYPNLTQSTDDGLYPFMLYHNKTYVGVIVIAPFVGEDANRPGPVINGEKTIITNVLHIHTLAIDNPKYQRMGLATILILYSICCCYLINQDFHYVTLDDTTNPGVDIYKKLDFMPLNNSIMNAPEKYTTISTLIGVTLPKMQQPTKLTERQAQLNANMNAGTRKTRRYRKKQRKTRRYRR